MDTTDSLISTHISNSFQFISTQQHDSLSIDYGHRCDLLTQCRSPKFAAYFEANKQMRVRIGWWVGHCNTINFILMLSTVI